MTSCWLSRDALHYTNLCLLSRRLDRLCWFHSSCCVSDFLDILPRRQLSPTAFHTACSHRLSSESFPLCAVTAFLTLVLHQSHAFVFHPNSINLRIESLLAACLAYLSKGHRHPVWYIQHQSITLINHSINQSMCQSIDPLFRSLYIACS